MFSPRTDLAQEAREMYLAREGSSSQIPGVDVDEIPHPENITVTRVKILNPQGEANLGKPTGNYITMDFSHSDTNSIDFFKNACNILSQELSHLIKAKGTDPILVAGLGNRHITADALGPKVVDSLLITRHLHQYMPHEVNNNLRSVCAIAPGVLGITGLETAEILNGLSEKVKPGLIIVIDALCSRRMERINKTIQLSDTGITPGSGIGNARMPINHETQGCPVIAIGVPTVTDAATIAGDTIDILTEELKRNATQGEELHRVLSLLADEDKYSLIKEILKPSQIDFVVTPKEIDSQVDNLAQIISNAINMALHPGIDFDNLIRFSK